MCIFRYGKLKKIEEIIKTYERDMTLNRDRTAIARFNNKSLIQMNFNQVEKVANDNNYNYASMHEEKSKICNGVIHVTIDNKW